MKRFCLVLFVLLLLSACGRAEPVATEPTTTEVELTTEEETTTEEEAETTQWWTLPSWSFALSDEITLFFQPSSECGIWMRDNRTGEETLLLEVYGEYNPVIPWYEGKISERYFAYSYAPFDTEKGGLVFYDVVKMRKIELPDFCFFMLKEVKDGKVYMYQYIEEYLEAIVYFDISALDSGGPIAVKALEQ